MNSETLVGVGGHIITVIIVFIAYRHTIAAFRRQKLIERRLDWYDAFHQTLINVPTRYAYAVDNRDNDKDAAREADETMFKCIEFAQSAMMYGDAQVYQTINAWIPTIAAIPPAGRGSRADAERLSDSCIRLASLFVHATREELGLAPVEPPAGYIPSQRESRNSLVT